MVSTKVSLESLLVDVHFLHYVLDDDVSQKSYWDTVAGLSEDNKQAVERAKSVLMHLDEPCNFVGRKEILRLRGRIRQTLRVR